MAATITMMETNLLLSSCSAGDTFEAVSVGRVDPDASPLVPGTGRLDDAGVIRVARLVSVGLSVPGPVVEAPGTAGRLANPVRLG